MYTPVILIPHTNIVPPLPTELPTTSYTDTNMVSDRTSIHRTIDCCVLWLLYTAILCRLCSPLLSGALWISWWTYSMVTTCSTSQSRNYSTGSFAPRNTGGQLTLCCNISSVPRTNCRSSSYLNSLQIPWRHCSPIIGVINSLSCMASLSWRSSSRIMSPLEPKDHWLICTTPVCTLIFEHWN